MKTKSNIALEGTFNGDVVGGLLLWAGENLQPFLFLLKSEALRAPTMGVLILPSSKPLTIQGGLGLSWE